MSKKKGMLSWLGFGKKEKQPSTEEINNEVQATAEQEQALAADPVEPLNEQLTEEVSEQTVELKTEVLAEPEVTPESTVDSNILDENIENIVTSEPVVVAPVIPKPAVESEDISPVAATEPMSELATEQRPEAILLAEMEAAEHVDVADESIIVDEVTLNVEPQPQETILVEAETTEEIAEVKTESKLGFFARLKKGLSKTRQSLGGGLVDLFRGKQIDDDLFEELETHLLLADVGVETTMKIIDSLTKSASRKQLKDASALYDLLKIELKKTIEGVSKPLVIPEGEGPFVMLMVGVNGVGKTTTIGKLAKQFQAEGKSVMLAAGDTFRAAAVEQLQVWGERNDITVIAQHTGADSASVIFDAISAAKARKVDVIIADTAGRISARDTDFDDLAGANVRQSGGYCSPCGVRAALCVSVARGSVPRLGQTLRHYRRRAWGRCRPGAVVAAAAHAAGAGSDSCGGGIRGLRWTVSADLAGRGWPRHDPDHRSGGAGLRRRPPRHWRLCSGADRRRFSPLCAGAFSAPAYLVQPQGLAQ